MNGWTPSTPLKTRLENLAAQIPQENRADAFARCMQDNPHDLERFLTAYVMTGKDDAPHPVDEAQEIEKKIDAEIAAWKFDNDPIVKRWSGRVVFSPVKSKAQIEREEEFSQKMKEIGAAVISRMYGSAEKMSSFRPYKSKNLEDMPF